MMENPSEEYDQPQLAERICQAMNGALTEKELEKIKNAQDRNTRRFLKKEIGRKKWERASKKLDEKTGAVIFDSFEKFEAALRIVDFTPEIIQQCVGDEKNHFLTTKSFGLIPKLQIQFLKQEDGNLAIYPSTRVEFPESMSDEEVRLKLRQIIEAPETLSPRDQSQLGI